MTQEKDQIHIGITLLRIFTCVAFSALFIVIFLVAFTLVAALILGPSFSLMPNTIVELLLRLLCAAMALLSSLFVFILISKLFMPSAIRINHWQLGIATNKLQTMHDNKINDHGFEVLFFSNKLPFTELDYFHPLKSSTPSILGEALANFSKRGGKPKKPNFFWDDQFGRVDVSWRGKKPSIKFKHIDKPAKGKWSDKISNTLNQTRLESIKRQLVQKLENEANAEAAILRANEDIRKLPDIILERALPELERHVRSGIPLPAKIETDLCCPTLGALQACGLGIGNYTLNGRAGEMISAPAIEEICLYWAHSSLAKNSRYKSMLRFLRENEIDTEIVLGKRIYIKLSDLKKDSDAIPFIRYQAS
jgi:hypothetical protein